ncbi:MAG: hypothetical protein Fues2KO_04790 [Fuerstiella sp.]
MEFLKRMFQGVGSAAMAIGSMMVSAVLSPFTSKQDAEPTGKWGQTHLEAMGRVGLKELSQILPAFPESVKTVEEPGLAGNALPQEVFKDRYPDKEMDVEQNLEMN